MTRFGRLSMPSGARSEMLVSAQGFFMVFFAYEGLSMWESQNGLPGRKRKDHFKEKWNEKIKNSDDPDKMKEALLCAKEHKKFTRRLFEASLVRWTPPLIALVAVLFYSVCPFFSVSAVWLFDQYSRWICGGASVLAILQFIFFVLVSRYFEAFDADTLVYDGKKKTTGFDLANDITKSRKKPAPCNEKTKMKKRATI